MYEEIKKINWLSLFVKVVIFVVFVLLVIWLFIKISNRNVEKTFEENMNTLKSASIEFFKNGNLPIEIGENKTVTLEELIKMKYLSDFDSSCSRENSYAQATLVDDYYALRIELECGENKDYIYTSIDSEGNCVGDDCNAEDDPVENLTPDDPVIENPDDEKDDTPEDKPQDSGQTGGGSSNGGSSGGGSSGGSSTGGGSSGGSSTGGGSSGGGSSTTSKTLYYEHVKVNKVYGNWQTDRISGSNVETKTEKRTMNTYCKLVTNDYYAIGYLTRYVSSGVYRFTIRLNDVPSNTTYLVFLTKEFYNNNSSLYSSHSRTSSNVTFITGGAYTSIPSGNSLKNSSLKSNNIQLVLASYYKSGNYVNVDYIIRLNNVSGVTPYQNLYFIPMHFKVQYRNENSCVTDLASNASRYNGYTVKSSSTANVTLYRSYTYKRDYNNVKWSTSKSLSGYEATGRTQWR